MQRILVWAMCSALIAPRAVWAQADSSPTARHDSPKVPELTVTAPRNRAGQKTYGDLADKFIGSQLADGPQGHLVRWTTAICPVVAGLSPAFNAFVRQRLLSVAGEIGVPNPKAGECKEANVLVIFTTEPAKLMDDIAAHYPGMLGAFYASDAKKSARFTPPMIYWQKASHVPGSVPHNRIRDGAAFQFMAKVVVVDPRVLEGQPIGRVADNIVARVLSDPGKRGGCTPLPSVLDALDPACPDSDTVEELTAYDKALLKGLYHSDPELAGSLERGAILHELLRTTHAPGAADVR